MESKTNAFISQYEKRLNTRENLVKPLHDKQNKFEELTDKEYTKMMILEAEIRQIKEFIDDLKYILEG